jgi:hypothetical protein
MAKTILTCTECHIRFAWYPMNRGVCSLDCEDTWRRRQIGKKCGECGEAISIQIARIYGGEEEVMVCGCPTDY